MFSARNLLIAVSLVLILATLALATSNQFVWRKTLDELNDPTTYATLPRIGDRGIVITDSDNTTFYRFDGTSWIPCGTVFATGIIVAGLVESQNNTTALSDNMTAGMVYRTEDLLKVVH